MTTNKSRPGLSSFQFISESPRFVLQHFRLHTSETLKEDSFRMRFLTLTSVLVSFALVFLNTPVLAAAEVPGLGQSGTASITAKYFSVAKMEKWDEHTYVPSYCNSIPNRQVKVVLGHVDNLHKRRVKEHLKSQVHGAGKNLKKGMDASVGAEDLSDSDDSVEENSENSTVAAAKMQATPNILRTRMDNYLGWHLDDTSFSRDHNGRFCLGTNKGEALISAEEHTSIQLGLVHIEVSPGSVVLVCHTNGFSQIINLYDTKRDAVRLKVGPNQMHLRPGHECIVAESESALVDCKKRDGSLRRFSNLAVLPGSNALVGVCEISIPSLLKCHPILSKLFKSKEKDERRLADKLLKMSVCLAFMGVSFEPYYAFVEEQRLLRRKRRRTLVNKKEAPEL